MKYKIPPTRFRRIEVYFTCESVVGGNGMLVKDSIHVCKYKLVHNTNTHEIPMKIYAHQKSYKKWESWHNIEISIFPSEAYWIHSSAYT